MLYGIFHISASDPVYREEEEAFNVWWTKTPLGRRFQKAQQAEIDEKLERESNNGKKKK